MFPTILNHRRTIRQRPVFVRRDPLLLSDEKLVAEYRMNREGIDYLADIMREELTSPTKRSMALSVEQQILISLKLLATGSFQKVAKDYVNVSQPTVSRCLDRFVNALLPLAPQYIYMPNENEIANIKRKFYDVKRFPGVIGAIDGTHIAMIAPRSHEHLYVCRKGFHSLNVQVSN